MQRHGLKPAKAHARRSLHSGRDLQVWPPPEQAGQRDLTFDPRDGVASAYMDPARKGQVRVVVAIKAEFIGRGKYRRVAIGRTHAKRDQRALVPLFAAHFEICHRTPVAQLVRAFHTQNFLNR